jgi:hypothetical protein
VSNHRCRQRQTPADIDGRCSSGLPGASIASCTALTRTLSPGARGAERACAWLDCLAYPLRPRGEADGAGPGGRAGGYEGRRRRTDCPYF